MTEARPDVVLADYHLPDGTGSDIARTVRATLPETSVLILTGDPSVSVLPTWPGPARSATSRRTVLRRGRRGRPRRRARRDPVRPERAPAALLERESRPRPLEPLTARELEVLQLLAEGASTTQASDQLGISSATLRAHVQAILRKLGAHSRLEAVAEAARLGVITLDAWSRDKAATRPKEVV